MENVQQRCQWEKPMTQLSVPMRFQPLKEYIDRLLESQLPWAEVMVIDRKEKVCCYRNGYCDLEKTTPVDESQIIYVFSMTKILTCLAGLQLLEKGYFQLSDPLSTYLPEFELMTARVLHPDGQEEIQKASQPILVRDLFTMSAGFSYNLNSPAIVDAVKQTHGKLSTRQFAIALAKEPLLFEPGTRWYYSLCHDVLGALIEVVSGLRFGQYIQEHITGPLGMIDTGFMLTALQQTRLAPLYEFKQGRVVRNDVNGHRLRTEFESGGAGLYSTVSDFALLLDAMTHGGVGANGTRIISAASLVLMRTDQLTDAMRSGFNWEHFAGYGYGLGVRTHISQSVSGSRSSLGEFGWSGAAGAFGLVDPHQQLTVMYAQHLIGGPIDHRPLKNIVYGCLNKE